MTILKRNLLIVAAILTVLLGIAEVNLLHAQGPSTSLAGSGNWMTAYSNAIVDASNAVPRKISTHLTPITPANTNLAWRTNSDGKIQVKVVAFLDLATSMQENWTPGPHLWTTNDEWVSAYPELMEFCFHYQGTNQLARMKQLLGLPLSSLNDTIVEFWVNPDDLFRPTPEPAINSVSAGLSASPNAPLISPSYRIPSFWPAWYNTNYAAQNYSMTGGVTNGRPFTQLGYTYDWNTNVLDHIGLSEFVIPSGVLSKFDKAVSVNIELPITAATYGRMPFPVLRDGDGLPPAPGIPIARFQSSRAVKIGDNVTIWITNLPPERLPQFSQPGKVVLILDGNPFSNLCVNVFPQSANAVLLHFNLAFNASNRSQWSQILLKPTNIHVQLQAQENPPQLIDCQDSLNLVAKDKTDISLAFGLLVLFGYVVSFLSARTALIRDTYPSSDTELPAGGLVGGFSTYSEGVIKELPALVKKLTDQSARQQLSDPVSDMLWRMIPIQEQAVLAQYQPAGQAPNPDRGNAVVQAIVIKVLNRTISGACIYDANRFPDNLLRKQTKKFVAANQSVALRGQMLARFNRLLLEDAYRLELWRKDDQAVLDGIGEAKRKQGVFWALAGAIVLVVLAIFIATLDHSTSWLSLCAGGLVVVVLVAVVGHFSVFWGPTRNAARKLSPYSLARTQMAVWFFLVVCSWVFLWLLTGTFNSLSNTVLALMGIGAGTALGAEAQNATKPTTAQDLETKIEALPPGDPHLGDLQEQYNRLIEKGPPKTVNFFQDVLTDTDGISFHRFQMFVWTLLLGIVFVVEVCQHLTMPDFDTTMLALMGISSGTYLGFMINEKHSSVEKPPQS